MTWDNITVEQFQQLTDIWQQSEGQETLFVLADMIQVCHGLTRRQVDSMAPAGDEFRRLCRELDFLNKQPEWKPVRHVVLNGRRYRFVYDVRQIHAARNIEVKHFNQGGFVMNMHKLAASMVMPQKRNWFGKWVDDTYDAAKHEQYASDLRQCPITAIYGSALFFCELFTRSTADILDSLKSKNPMIAEIMSSHNLSTADLSKILAGNLTQSQSPSWSGLP